MISTTVISCYAAPSYRAAPDFHLKVKLLTMICASLALLQIMFAVHPRESVSHDPQVALLPYESCSLATPSGGQNKTPLNILFISISIVSTGYSTTELRGMVVAPATKGGLHFLARQGGCMVFPAAARQHLYWRP